MNKNKVIGIFLSALILATVVPACASPATNPPATVPPINTGAVAGQTASPGAPIPVSSDARGVPAIAPTRPAPGAIVNTISPSVPATVRPIAVTAGGYTSPSPV